MTGWTDEQIWRAREEMEAAQTSAHDAINDLYRMNTNLLAEIDRLRAVDESQQEHLTMLFDLVLHGGSVAKGVMDTYTEALPVLQADDAWEDIEEETREMLEGYLNYDQRVATSYRKRADPVIEEQRQVAERRRQEASR